MQSQIDLTSNSSHNFSNHLLQSVHKCRSESLGHRFSARPPLGALASLDSDERTQLPDLEMLDNVGARARARMRACACMCVRARACVRGVRALMPRHGARVSLAQ
jgi:hypothetical protein